jgi:hypothetical protein
MKKYVSIFVAVTGAFIICAMIINPLTLIASGKEGGGKPIPADVVKIAERSCLKCHAEHGNQMAMSHVNLSNWDKYSPEKQASKAKEMCKMVTEDKMPPKKFRESNPGAAPTKEEIKTICDWAESIQMPKK